MKAFSDLIFSLERAAASLATRVELCQQYFSSTNRAATAAAIRILLAHETKAVLSSAQARELACKFAEIDAWLYDESYRSVSDHAETLALIVPRAELPGTLSLCDCLEILENLKDSACSSAKAEDILKDAWNRLSEQERIVFNKMLLGRLNISGTRVLLISALSKIFGVSHLDVACRLESPFLFEMSGIDELMNHSFAGEEDIHPFTFCQVKEVCSELDLSCLDYDNLVAEWSWKGIRAQLIKRNGKVTLWSSEFDNLSQFFPELISESAGLADGTVIEGVIVPYKDADVLPKSMLSVRLKKKVPTRQLLQESPVAFMAYDLLEEEGQSLLSHSLQMRKQKLLGVLSNKRNISSEEEYQQLSLFAPCKIQLSSKIKASPSLSIANESELRNLLADVRLMKAGGLIMKDHAAPYTVSEGQAVWLSLRPEPIFLKAVLVAAQADERRRNFFSDYTLAVWRNEELVSVVRTTANLSDEEMCRVDNFVQQNVIGRFGPVLTVKPHLVFELSCDGMSKSTRHKSGFVLNRPRILRLRSDLSVNKADALDKLNQFCEL